jgi:hypothetical protein
MIKTSKSITKVSQFGIGVIASLRKTPKAIKHRLKLKAAKTAQTLGAISSPIGTVMCTS